MKTTFVNPQSVDRQWYVFDAEGKTLGRFATEIANILRGKNKPSFSPSHDTGDNVIIINADKIKLTGSKMESKYYFRHSGYVGGLKTENAATVMGKNPTKVVFQAIRGMVPRNRNRKDILSKLHIYAGTEHPHEAQKPVTLEL
jgi:large subunit ribosomal protein L13